MHQAATPMHDLVFLYVLLLISKNLTYGLPWNTVIMSGLVLLAVRYVS